MRAHFTGRHVEVTPALETFGRERLAKLQKFLPPIIEAHVILSVEKYRHRAEVNLHTRHGVLSGTTETGDMYSSLSLVFEKLERQARRRKEKITSSKRRGRGLEPAEAALETLVAGQESGRGRAPGSGRPPASRRRREPGQDSGGTRAPRVVRTESVELKPMSIEDAVLQIQDTEHGFLVFRNARSQRVNVVYRRGDGRYAVIEP